MRKVGSRHGMLFRKILSDVEDEPLAGMVNLFDAGMVFAVALLLALVTYYSLPELLTERDEITLVKNPGEPNMEIIKKKGIKLEKYRMTTQRIGGEGEKLGVCYRLKTGEVVYIPEKPDGAEDKESK
jgi:hypothetical protein